jgi:pSer/pThr/pTyr-binding forkhead associated (FHA) protein
MTDARLNSVHLESPRRQEFRAARDMLLHARGGETMAAEQQHLAALSGGSPTAVQKQGGTPPVARYVLMDSEYVYPLKVGLNTIGRMPDNDVVLQDAYVSRRHCAVLVHLSGDVCELHDIASKNGTLLNGQRINGPTRLKPGDEIRMCNRQLVFVTRAEAAEVGGQHTQAE